MMSRRADALGVCVLLSCALSACPQGNDISGAPDEIAPWSENEEKGEVKKTAEVSSPGVDIDTNIFFRQDYRPCSYTSTSELPYAVDDYQTISVSHPSTCARWSSPASPDFSVARGFSADDECYRDFLQLIHSRPKKAIARWIFALTQAQGPLGQPDQLVVSHRPHIGVPLVDGGNNRGIFTVSSPGWATSMTVKIASGGSEVRLIAQNSLLPPTRPQCQQSSRLHHLGQMSEEEAQTGPWFPLPVAAMLYHDQGDFVRSDEEPGDLTGGVILMRTAEGVSSQRDIPFGDLFFERSLAGARLEGRALALFQLPQLTDDGDDVLGQAIWCHGDLHHGNVIVDHAEGRVHYLDYERMSQCVTWFDETLRAFGNVDSASPDIYLLADRALGGRASCLAALEGWLADPDVVAQLAGLDAEWLADRLRFVAFSSSYLGLVPSFARPALQEAFDAACWAGVQAGARLRAGSGRPGR